MQYKSTKNKIYKTWVKTITSKEEISKLKQSQDRLTKKTRTLEINYMKKANHYESDWQTIDYWSVGSDTYISAFSVPILGIPICKIPSIHTNLIFKGPQELIDDLQRFDNCSAIMINTTFIMHEHSPKSNIIAESYNMDLFVGIEIINDIWENQPAIYTNLQVKVAMGFN